jgi:hypothetical protein
MNVFRLASRSLAAGTVLALGIAVASLGMLTQGPLQVSQPSSGVANGYSPAASPAPQSGQTAASDGFEVLVGEWRRIIAASSSAALSGKPAAIPVDSQNGPVALDPATGEYNQPVIDVDNNAIRQMRTRSAEDPMVREGRIRAATRALKLLDRDVVVQGRAELDAVEVTLVASAGVSDPIVAESAAGLAEIIVALDPTETTPFLITIVDRAGQPLLAKSSVPNINGRGTSVGQLWLAPGVESGATYKLTPSTR